MKQFFFIPVLMLTFLLAACNFPGSNPAPTNNVDTSTPEELQQQAQNEDSAVLADDPEDPDEEMEDEMDDDEMNDDKDDMDDDDEMDDTEEMKDDDTMKDEEMKKDQMEKEDQEANAVETAYAAYSDGVIGNGSTSVLFFHAAWCPKCQANDGKLTGYYGNGNPAHSTYKIDYDSAPADLKQKFGITQQDAFVVVDGAGNQVGDTVFFPSEAKLKELIGA